jgi:DNA polymerase III sliding clamp (beta) subunit (PCNA family)
MIVLKDTLEKVLSILQSIAGIVERRNTLPILAHVLLSKGNRESKELSSAYEPSKTAREAAQHFRPASSSFHTTSDNVHLICGLKSFRQGSVAVSHCFVGFFSSSKANLRNAP